MIHDALQAFLQYRNIEIDQQTDTPPRKLQVSQELSFMYRRKAFDRFNLHNHEVVNNQIHAIAAIQLHALVYDWNATWRR